MILLFFKLFLYVDSEFDYLQVVESQCDSDGAALSIYQCFENVRNFLVAVGQMGIPTFEASDLVQVGVLLRNLNKRFKLCNEILLKIVSMILFCIA